MSNGLTWWMDLTYGGHDWPILAAPGPEGFQPLLSCGEDFCHECPYRTAGCTQWTSLAWANISVETIRRALPEELRFDCVKGHYTGQCSLEHFGETYDFSHEMLAYGADPHTVFYVRHEEGTVVWMGLYVYVSSTADWGPIDKLLRCVRECTDLPLYLCVTGWHPELFRIDQIDWKNFQT